MVTEIRRNKGPMQPWHEKAAAGLRHGGDVSWRDFAPPKSPGRSGHGRGRRCCTGLDASPERIHAAANERAENAGNDDVAGVTRGIVKVSQEGELASNGSWVRNVHPEQTETFLKRPPSRPSWRAFPCRQRSSLRPLVIVAHALTPSRGAVKAPRLLLIVRDSQSQHGTRSLPRQPATPNHGNGMPDPAPAARRRGHQPIGLRRQIARHHRHRHCRARGQGKAQSRNQRKSFSVEWRTDLATEWQRAVGWQLPVRKKF